MTSASSSRSVNVLYVVIAIVSICGLTDALYLTVEHLTGESVQCTVIHGCSEVLSSSYATIAGYPLAGLGALAYFTVFSLAILALFRYHIAGKLLLPLVLVMCLVSLWLIYLQAFVIHAFCQFCLLSAATTFVLTALVIVLRRVSSR
ncbi:MAG TPA: vitamin K epoxide reductase family protein [Pyrinomonadaceae bacterium]